MRIMPDTWEELASSKHPLIWLMSIVLGWSILSMVLAFIISLPWILTMKGVL